MSPAPPRACHLLMALELVQRQIRRDIGHNFEGWQLQEALLEDWGQWALEISMQALEYVIYLIRLTRWKHEQGRNSTPQPPGRVHNATYWEGFQQYLEDGFWDPNGVNIRDLFLICEHVRLARIAALHAGA